MSSEIRVNGRAEPLTVATVAELLSTRGIAGGRGLAVWVREAFRELPVEDRDVLVVIGLEET